MYVKEIQVHLQIGIRGQLLLEVRFLKQTLQCMEHGNIKPHFLKTSQKQSTPQFEHTLQMIKLKGPKYLLTFFIEDVL